MHAVRTMSTRLTPCRTHPARYLRVSHLILPCRTSTARRSRVPATIRPLIVDRAKTEAREVRGRTCPLPGRAIVAFVLLSGWCTSLVWVTTARVCVTTARDRPGIIASHSMIRFTLRARSACSALLILVATEFISSALNGEPPICFRLQRIMILATVFVASVHLVGVAIKHSPTGTNHCVVLANSAGADLRCYEAQHLQRMSSANQRS